MTGYCVMGDHDGCPDSKRDSYVCSCPCHIEEIRKDRNNA